MPADLKYRRVLLKVSGEALMGERDYGLDPLMIERIAGEIQSVHDLGVELCLVIGGGNIFRGLSGEVVGMERAPVGSQAVACCIERYQPVLSLHGHVHESRGMARIGWTMALKPGS